MRLQPILATLALAVASANADVIVYTLTQSGKVIGNGVNGSFTASGFLYFDVDSQTVGTFSVLSKTNQFTIETPAAGVFDAAGTAGTTFTGLGAAAENTPGAVLASALIYGQNSLLAIRPTRTVNGPKSASGPYIVVLKGEQTVINNSTISLTFNQALTQAANAAGQTIAQLQAAQKAKYLAKGYTQAPSNLQ